MVTRGWDSDTEGIAWIRAVGNLSRQTANPVLDLRFSTLARGLVSSYLASARHLQILRGRYASSASISNQAFDLEIDDLLVNLHELAAWPSDDVDIRRVPLDRS